MSRSTDGGLTWSAPTTVIANGHYNDREAITADPRQPGVAYEAFVDRLGAFGETGVQATSADQSKRNLKLLWIGCGRQDQGFANAERLSHWMTDHGIQNTWHPSEGAHQWPVWRRYLGEFLPLLFT